MHVRRFPSPARLIGKRTFRRGIAAGMAVALGAGGARITGLAAELPPPEATEQWHPVPPVVAAPSVGVPSDAIVLFDGTTVDAWERVNADGAEWILKEGMLVVPAGRPATDLRTKRTFGDVQVHLEFRTPAEVTSGSQGRGNSGVFLMGLYEVQILDSWENPTYVNGQAAATYKQSPPLVNASRRPGEWQSYDLVFIAPRFSEPDGALLAPARVTVIHNGVLVQYDRAFRGPTLYQGNPRYEAHAPKLPLVLQHHGNAVAFRNIWVRELPATVASEAPIAK